MAKTATASGGVEQTIIQKSIIPAEDATKAPGYGEEFYEYIARLTPDEWENHIVYLYRKFPQSPTGKNTYIDKIGHSFDEEWLQKNHGGGVYHYILKCGSQRIKEGDTEEIAGAPKSPGYTQQNGYASGAAASGAPQSELVEALRLVLNERRNPAEQSGTEIMKQAFINAMEIQKTANATPPVTIESLTNAMKNMKELTGGAQPAIPAWLAPILTPLIPAVVGLFTNMITPKDPLTTIKGVTDTMAALSAISGGQAKPDLMTTLVNQGPSLLSHFKNVLEELRVAEQIRQQNILILQKNPPVVPVVHPAPAVPVHANPAPAVDQSGINKGAPDPAWILRQIAKMCLEGQSGGFAFDFLAQIDEAFVIQIKQATLEQLKQFIEGDPHLKVCVTSPNYETFLSEFFAALQAYPVPASNGKPN